MINIDAKFMCSAFDQPPVIYNRSKKSGSLSMNTDKFRTHRLKVQKLPKYTQKVLTLLFSPKNKQISINTKKKAHFILFSKQIVTILYNTTLQKLMIQLTLHF